MMKTLKYVLSIVLLLTAGAFAQNSVSGTITAASTDCTVGQSCVVLNNLTTGSSSNGAVSITASGTFSATMTVEVSNDASSSSPTWTTWTATDGSTTGFTSASGQQWNVAGWTSVRVRCSAFTSGTVNVTIQASQASARGGGGGGGGAAFTPNAIQYATSTTASRATTPADIVALWTGTCTGSNYLGGDGNCYASSGGASYGTQAVNVGNGSGGFTGFQYIKEDTTNGYFGIADHSTTLGHFLDFNITGFDPSTGASGPATFAGTVNTASLTSNPTHFLDIGVTYTGHQTGTNASVYTWGHFRPSGSGESDPHDFAGVFRADMAPTNDAGIAVMSGLYSSWGTSGGSGATGATVNSINGLLIESSGLSAYTGGGTLAITTIASISLPVVPAIPSGVTLAHAIGMNIPDMFTTPRGSSSNCGIVIGASVCNTTAALYVAKGKIQSADATVTNALAGDLTLGGTGHTGVLGMKGTTSGTVNIQAQSVAGTPTLTLPNTTGTFAVGATSPIVLSATTGGLSLQNTSSANLTSGFVGSNTKAPTTADTTGNTVGNVVTVDAQHGHSDSGTALTALAPLASPTFTGTVTMPAPTLNNVTGSTQCLHVNSSGSVTGTGSDCGSGGSSTFALTTSAQTGDYTVLNTDFTTNGSGKLLQFQLAYSYGVMYKTFTLPASGSAPTDTSCVWINNSNPSSASPKVPSTPLLLTAGSGTSLNGVATDTGVIWPGDSVQVCYQSSGTNYWVAAGRLSYPTNACGTATSAGGSGSTSQTQSANAVRAMGFVIPSPGCKIAKIYLKAVTGDGTNASSAGVFDTAGNFWCHNSTAITTTSATLATFPCAEGTVYLAPGTWIQGTVTASTSATFGAAAAGVVPYWATTMSGGGCSSISGGQFSSTTACTAPSYGPVLPAQNVPGYLLGP